jgi:hypothetical protein
MWFRAQFWALGRRRYASCTAFQNVPHAHIYICNGYLRIFTVVVEGTVHRIWYTCWCPVNAFDFESQPLGNPSLLHWPRQLWPSWYSDCFHCRATWGVIEIRSVRPLSHCRATWGVIESHCHVKWGFVADIVVGRSAHELVCHIPGTFLTMAGEQEVFWFSCINCLWHTGTPRQLLVYVEYFLLFRHSADFMRCWGKSCPSVCTTPLEDACPLHRG